MNTKVPINLLREAIDYDPYTGALTWKPRQGAARWNGRFAGKPALNSINEGYLTGSVFGHSTRAHRVAWAIFYGYWPRLIDHINGIKTDNRIMNLRDVTHVENARNTRMNSRNKTGCMGVRQHKRRWRATITVLQKQRLIGDFATIEEAIAARRAAEAEHGFTERHGR